MNSIIIYLLQSSTLIIACYAVYWLFLKKETFFTLNRIYLLVGVAFSTLLPLLKIPSPIITKQVVYNETIPDNFIYQPTESISMSDVLLTIYFIGVAIFFIRLLFYISKIVFLIKKNSITTQHGCRYVFCEDDISPFSFFRIIFISKTKTGDLDFDRIVAHERAHIRQCHSIDSLVLELLIVFQWFNPFVWPYRKSLKETHEYLADEAVIAQGCDTATYQMLIFEQFVGEKVFAFANNLNKSQIKRRITMMTKHKSHKKAKLKALFVVPFLLIVVVAFAKPRMVENAADFINNLTVESISTSGYAKSSLDNAAILYNAAFNQDDEKDKKLKEEKLKQKEKEEKLQKIQEEITKLKEMETTSEKEEVEKKKKIAELKKLAMKIKSDEVKIVKEEQKITKEELKKKLEAVRDKIEYIKKQEASSDQEQQKLDQELKELTMLENKIIEKLKSME